MGGCVTHDRESGDYPANRPEAVVCRILSATHVPRADLLSESDAFVEVDLIRADDPHPHKAKALTTLIRTGYRRDCVNPVWETIRSVPLPPGTDNHDPAIAVRFAIWDYDELDANDLLGYALVSLEDFKVGDIVQLEVNETAVVARPKRSKRASIAFPEQHGMPRTPSAGSLATPSAGEKGHDFLAAPDQHERHHRSNSTTPFARSASGKFTLSVSRLHQAPDLVRRRVFLIRHGESQWNAAQADREYHKMLAYDHPLNDVGIRQAQGLHNAWKSANKNEQLLGERGKQWHDHFMDADVVVSSPLTRALQTALLVLEKHPSLTRTHLRLMSAVRELKKVGGMDTVGIAVGDEIPARVFSELSKSLGHEHATRLLKSDTCGSVIRIGDCDSEWWTLVNEHDTPGELQARMHDLMFHLHYSSSKSSAAIVVGHSLFFLDYVNKYLQLSPASLEAIQAEQPTVLQDIQKCKLSNAGCLGLDIEFRLNEPVRHPIRQHRLYFYRLRDHSPQKTSVPRALSS